MRTAQRIRLVIETMDEVYNPDTGSYEGGTANEVVLPCFISDLGLERSMVVFGDYRKERKVVRLLRPYTNKVDYAMFDNQKYRIIIERLDATVWYLERENHGN